jgi:hypothetical protein
MRPASVPAPLRSTPGRPRPSCVVVGASCLIAVGLGCSAAAEPADREAAATTSFPGAWPMVTTARSAFLVDYLQSPLPTTIGFRRTFTARAQPVGSATRLSGAEADQWRLDIGRRRGAYGYITKGDRRPPPETIFEVTGGYTILSRELGDYALTAFARLRDGVIVAGLPHIGGLVLVLVGLDGVVTKRIDVSADLVVGTSELVWWQGQAYFASIVRVPPACEVRLHSVDPDRADVRVRRLRTGPSGTCPRHVAIGVLEGQALVAHDDATALEGKGPGGATPSTVYVHLEPLAAWSRGRAPDIDARPPAWRGHRN